MNLYELNNQYREIKAMLEDPDWDKQAVLDTLEGIEGEITAKADSLACIIREMEADMVGIDAEIDRLKKMKESKETSVKNVRNYLASMVDKYKLDHEKSTCIETGKFKLYSRHTIETVVPDEKEFIKKAKENGWSDCYSEKISVKESVDKVKIKSLIQDFGIDFGELAKLVENVSLQIK